MRLAEQAGFDVGMSSDHFSPWSERQGESGFAWAWLGAALATTALPFRVVNAPGLRYHPAIVAHAIATLVEMFPGRLWVCLGTGEASNEHITGAGWPAKSARNDRLIQCVQIIRALLAGEEVSHRGLVTVDRARLHTRPDEPPPLLGAAATEETARWAGGWADGLATVHQPREQLERVVDAFRDGGGESVSRTTNGARTSSRRRSAGTSRRRSTSTRRPCPELGLGRCTLIETGDPAVLGQQLDWENTTMLTLHHLGGDRASVRLVLGDDAKERA